MRKKLFLTGIVGALSLIVILSVKAQTPGPEHCAIYCEPSVIYDCKIWNTVTHEEYFCTKQQMKGTPPPNN